MELHRATSPVRTNPLRRSWAEDNEALLLDYLVIGHATQDLKGPSFELGGTAAYAARTAQALGGRVGVLTSVCADLDLSESLSDILIARLLAPASTIFENTYTGAGRQQMIHSVAAPLGPASVPSGWQARVVHIGPVAQECDPALVHSFEGAFIGVTPQGWMRRWGDEGRVRRCRWADAERVIRHADAVVLSERDIGGDMSVVADYVSQAQRLVLTQGAAGCTVYAHGEVRRFPAPSVREVDSTGAGDIFAACLFYVLQQGHDVWAAARFANCIAARSVTRPGLLGTPRKQEVVRCRRVALRAERNDVHYLCAG